MAALYLLQEFEGFPLGYSFRLYTYGPYDAEVLSDLAHGLVASRLVVFPGGHERYLYRAVGRKKSAPEAVEKAAEIFADRPAGEVETLGTILFVAKRGRKGDLAAQVSAIKPRVEASKIQAAIAELRKLGYLRD